MSCQLLGQRGRNCVTIADLKVIVFGAANPIAESPKQTVAVTADWLATPWRKVPWEATRWVAGFVVSILDHDIEHLL